MLDKFLQKLAAIKQALTNNRPNEALIIGRESLALIRLRIQNTGKDAINRTLGNYSTTDIPAWFFRGKSVNASGRAGVEKAIKANEKISYSDFRQFNNRETKFVDLTFTGAMWREMEAIITTNNAERTNVSIQPTTPRTAKVLGYNVNKYGRILDNTESEINMLSLANKNRVLKVFRDVLGR